MGFWEGFFNPGFFFALCFIAVLQPVVILILDRLERHTQDVAVTHGILEYLGRPFAYALLVVLFLLLAYPALFGLDEAPSFADILAANGKNASNLINLVFLLGLFLPAVPIFGRYKGTVNALQVIITSGAFFLVDGNPRAVVHGDPVDAACDVDYSAPGHDRCLSTFVVVCWQPAREPFGWLMAN
ncbi:MAG: hypothetical protein ABFS02_00915 [Pseudomonadota bacterium]